MLKKILIFFCGVLTVIGCSRSFKAPAHRPQPSDTLYTAKAAMKIYGTQPEKALAIIDSALAVGNVSPFRAQFLRAKIHANSLEGLQRDQAIVLCEELLEHDSTQVVDKATAANRNDVLDVMMDACRKNKDDKKWLRYAIERAQLSRDQGMETESLRMEAEIGAAMARVGRREEGMIKLEQVIGALEKGAPSVDRMDAGIGASYASQNGPIVIHGGDIDVHGGVGAAGIGSGCEYITGGQRHGGSLTVTGGYVEAHAGEDGAGIGGGEDAYGGNVTITGGEVRAYGSPNGTTIGAGEDGGSDGSLTLGDLLMVRPAFGEGWFAPVAADQRVNTCRNHTGVWIMVCNHPEHTPENCPYHKHP